MTQATINIISGLGNGVVPCEGAKCVPFIADFNLASVYDFDFTTAQQGGQISSIQTVFIDNSANGSALVITIDGTQQSFSVKANTCGFYILIAPMATRVHATTVGLVKVYFAFLNFYIPPTVWSTI